MTTTAIVMNQILVLITMFDHRVLGPPVCCSPLLTEVHRATSHEPEAAGSSVRECGALDEVLLAVSGGAVGLGALWRLYLREYLW